MSILEFMEMSVGDCIIYALVSLIAIICYAGVGSIFAPRQGLALRAVIGMSFTAGFVVLSLSWAAVLAKYIIFASVLVGAAVTLYRRSLSRQTLLALVPTVLLFTFFLAKILSWVMPEQGIIEYNCHSVYFSDIPIEAARAEYFSRVRLADVYPYEWSRYHMFNGAYTATLLAFLPKANYLSYLLMKFMTIALYMGAVFELVREQSKNFKIAVTKFLLGMGLVYLAAFKLVTLSAYINNYSCAFMLLLAWLLFAVRKYRLAVIFAIAFAATGGRSILPGTGLFFYGLYLVLKENGYSFKHIGQLLRKDKYLTAFILVLGFSILATGLSGKSPSGQVVFNFHFIANITSWGWNVLMPLGGYLMQIIAVDPRQRIVSELLIAVIYTVLIYANREALKNIWQRLTPYHRAIKIIGLILLLATISIVVFSHHRRIRCYQLSTFVIIYAVPIMAVLMAAREQMRRVALIFINIAIAQGLIFDANVVSQNYALIAIIVVGLFVDLLVEKINVWRYAKNTVIAGIIVGTAALASYNFQVPLWGEKDYFFQVYHELVVVEKTDKPFEYYSADDAALARLNAMKGNRVHYNILPDVSEKTMQINSISMRFLPKDYRENGILPSTAP